MELMSTQPHPPTRGSVYSVSLSWNLSLEVVNNRGDTSRKTNFLQALTWTVSTAWSAINGNGREPSKTTIIKNVVGHIDGGSMLAIMGASGAGKTSLLHCLALRTSLFKGELLANGQAVDQNEFPKIAGYVHQDDLFISTVTPREHLNFVASLTLNPESVSPACKHERVNQALEDMGLTRVADILIGGGFAQIKGISGGERKRLSIAVELIRDPSLLLLDEPTSGLDSFMAKTVVEKLENLASCGHTVVATIHQPSSEVFSKFSHVCLLVEGGRVAYCGPRESLVEYFDSQFMLKCPSFYNPADFFIDALAIHPGSQEDRAKNETHISSIVEQWNSSAQRKHILDRIEVVSGQTRTRSSIQLDLENGRSEVAVSRCFRISRSGERLENSVYTAPFFNQLKTILWRTRLFYARDPIMTKARVAQTLFLAVMVGSMFIWSRNDDEFRAQNVMGAILIVVVNQSILGMFGVVQVFPMEVPIFIREHGSRMYTVPAYFLGRTLAELPFQIIFPFVFTVIVYFMAGLRYGDSSDDVGRFFLFCIAIVLCANAATSLGYVVSALAPSTQIALALGPVSLLPLIVFGGFFLNSEAIPPYFCWLEPFSFFQYGYHAASAFVWEGQTLTCPGGVAVCPFTSGDAVLSYLSVDPDEKYLNLVYIVVLIVGFRVLAYLALYRRVRISREQW